MNCLSDFYIVNTFILTEKETLVLKTKRNILLIRQNNTDQPISYTGESYLETGKGMYRKAYISISTFILHTSNNYIRKCPLIILAPIPHIILRMTDLSTFQPIVTKLLTFVVLL